MCFARVRPVAIGLMAGGTLFTAAGGVAARPAVAPPPPASGTTGTSGSGTPPTSDSTPQTSAAQTPTTATLAAFRTRTATTPQPSLCVSVQRSQDSIARGQAASWQVGVWAQNGDASSVVIRLATAPASEKAAFSFGCGSQDGGTACSLGTVTSGSAAREVLAKVTVPATATSVSSVKLTASLSAAHLTKTAAAGVGVSVTAPAATTPPGSPSPPGSNPGAPNPAGRPGAAAAGA